MLAQNRPDLTMFAVRAPSVRLGFRRGINLCRDDTNTGTLGVVQTSNRYPRQHSECLDIIYPGHILKSILRDVGLLIENAPAGRLALAS